MPRWVGAAAYWVAPFVVVSRANRQLGLDHAEAIAEDDTDELLELSHLDDAESNQEMASLYAADVDATRRLEDKLASRVPLLGLCVTVALALSTAAAAVGARVAVALSGISVVYTLAASVLTLHAGATTPTVTVDYLVMQSDSPAKAAARDRLRAVALNWRRRVQLSNAADGVQRCLTVAALLLVAAGGALAITLLTRPATKPASASSRVAPAAGTVTHPRLAAPAPRARPSPADRDNAWFYRAGH